MSPLARSSFCPRGVVSCGFSPLKNENSEGSQPCRALFSAAFIPPVSGFGSVHGCRISG